MACIDHYLKGADNGWEKTPPVQLTLRRPDGNTMRYEQQWPLARTQWTRIYLDGADRSLAPKPHGASSVTYAAIGDGVTFTTTPFARDTELTGPLAAHLFASSSTADMGCVRDDPRLRSGGQGGDLCRGQRPCCADHAELAARPWHPHDEVQKLTPGQVYPLDVEIWPTSIVLPKGYRLAVTLQGKDFERPGTARQRGSGPFLHVDPADRGADVRGDTSIATGGTQASYLLLPVIPAR